MDAAVCVISVIHGPDLFIFEWASVCVDSVQMMNEDTTSHPNNHHKQTTENSIRAISSFTDCLGRQFCTYLAGSQISQTHH